MILLFAWMLIIREGFYTVVLLPLNACSAACVMSCVHASFSVMEHHSVLHPLVLTSFFSDQCPQHGALIRNSMVQVMLSACWIGLGPHLNILLATLFLWILQIKDVCEWYRKIKKFEFKILILFCTLSLHFMTVLRISISVCSISNAKVAYSPGGARVEMFIGLLGVIAEVAVKHFRFLRATVFSPQCCILLRYLNISR